ncbi:MAG: hypothetical protein IPM97_03890 [Bdellovibrionaceae bacterium]|nr:hypothetical protein [Pseudobdellovibrionaceae bacterium]
MKFDDFLNQAWNDHATQANQVADKLSNGINLIENSEQIPQLAQLITHVFRRAFRTVGRWSPRPQ